MTGTISNIVVAKKFGFISGENGKEYFFHMKDIITDWDELVSDFSNSSGGKVKVIFKPTKTPKGLRANDVSVMEG